MQIIERFFFIFQDIFKSNNCRTDYLEIRDGYWHKSPILGRYCGSGKIMELIKSSSSRMLLTLVTTYRQNGLRGFAANYEGIEKKLLYWWYHDHSSKILCVHSHNCFQSLFDGFCQASAKVSKILFQFSSYDSVVYSHKSSGQSYNNHRCTHAHCTQW